MAGMIEEHIQKARQLLAEVEAEYQRAQEEIGIGVIMAWRSSCDKGCLAVLEAAKAFLLKQGVAQDELPDTDFHADRDMAHRGMSRFIKFYDWKSEVGRAIIAYHFLWNSFYECYGESFELMPRYFEDLQNFIDGIEAAPVQERVAE